MLHQLGAGIVALPGGAFLWSTLSFVVVIGILVFVHEFGHYLAARSVGVRVEVFSIGFGREIFGWNDRTGTRWKVSLLPLGGYVKMFAMTGEMQPHEVPTEQHHEAFITKSVLRRMWVVFAGPFANFLFAAVVLSGLFYFQGERRLYPEVGGVVANSAAAEAGLQPGDFILSVGGQPVQYWDELVSKVTGSHGQAQAVVVKKADGTQQTLQIAPRKVEITNIFGEKITLYQIGITSGAAFARVKHGLGMSAVLGVERTYVQTATILKALWRMVTLQMPAEIGGPLTIGKVAGDNAAAGFESLLLFMVVISINLGLINLFPVPVLDGGHLLYFSIEALLRRPLSERAQELGNKFGFGLLMLLMTFAFYKDIINIIMPIFGGHGS